MKISFICISENKEKFGLKLGFRNVFDSLFDVLVNNERENVKLFKEGFGMPSLTI